MTQAVYVDLLFMINFSMDFLCFFLSARITSLALRLPRLLAASALGGIYSCLALIWGISGIIGIGIDILICVLMCFIAFGRSGIVHNCVVYIAVSAVLGGFMTALFELFNRAGMGNITLEEDGVSAWMLLLLAMLASVASLMGGRFFRRRAQRRYASVIIELDGSKTRLRAFCDSGNLLCDPISGRPCILVCRGAIEEQYARLRAAAEARERSGKEYSRRIRLIPARSATGRGMLIGFRADSVRVVLDEKSESEVDALIAVVEDGGFMEDCEALLPLELLS